MLIPAHSSRLYFSQYSGQNHYTSARIELTSPSAQSGVKSKHGPKTDHKPIGTATKIQALTGDSLLTCYD